MTAKNRSFFVSVYLPPAVREVARDSLSQILAKVAAGFSFQGMEDWAVELPAGLRVLGAEREFHDLRSKSVADRRLCFYFSNQRHGSEFAKLVAASFPELRVRNPQKLAPKDWMREWRRFYKTQKIVAGGKSIFVVPAWKKPPALGNWIKIHPGQAFGTGTHPTTRLCVQTFLELSPNLKTPTKILDFGAGSGVLGLSALVLKENSGVCAVESDPVAREQCRKNTKINRKKMRVLASIPKSKKFDFIFANVLAPVLLRFRNPLIGAISSKGFLVLSGILETESTKFIEEFSHSKLRLLGKRLEGDWVALLFQKI